jgi:hypothetical protein
MVRTFSIDAAKLEGYRERSAAAHAALMVLSDEARELRRARKLVTEAKERAAPAPGRWDAKPDVPPIDLGAILPGRPEGASYGSGFVPVDTAERIIREKLEPLERRLAEAEKLFRHHAQLRDAVNEYAKEAGL